jgi:hypothetical protein
MTPEAVSWFDVSGNEWPLNNDIYFIPSPGMTGIYGQPITIVAHQVPNKPGDVVQYIQTLPGDVRFPLTIFGNDWSDIEVARRDLLEATRPGRGTGKLRHTANDGTVRDLNCIEIGRFADIVSRTPSAFRTSLVFRASDPYWYDTDYSSQLLLPAGATSFFGSPMLPIKLSAGGVSGGFTLENMGQAEAWPLWTITGPGVNPILTNATTGDVLTLTITLTAGQVLTIDTNPATMTVMRENGSDQWAAVSSLSNLWSLVVGANVIQLGMTGTTSASSLQVSWKNRWEGV